MTEPINPDSSLHKEQMLRENMIGGILLITAAVLALILANSPLAFLYNLLIDIPVQVKISDLEIAKPLLLWVNDGLMAIFFLLVGLELKREFLIGDLTKKGNVILPAVGAVGGMVAPALFYILFNYDNPLAMDGWAIPTATDIAFVLGILALLGSRVPPSIKLFLTSLAIFDDIGAIVIIAIFYTEKISFLSLSIVSVCLALLFICNRLRIMRLSPYLVVGLVMWVALLKSGVHATLAGVLLAQFIPMHHEDKARTSPVIKLEHDLSWMVSFIILPIFAFCNSGISFKGLSIGYFLHGVPLGIVAGLFLGKQVGIFGSIWLAVKCRILTLPDKMDWLTLYGASVLCGVGFTMSLFIGSLAFDHGATARLFDERIGIILGSFLSGILGYFVLRKAFAKVEKE